MFNGAVAMCQSPSKKTKKNAISQVVGCKNNDGSYSFPLLRLESEGSTQKVNNSPWLSW